MEDQIEMVGRAFVDHYYNLFDNDRSALTSLYQPTSMLSFEGQQMIGVEAISDRLHHLPFEQCKHVISTIDSQPSSTAAGIIVFVSGYLHLQGEEHNLRFSQMFHLIPAPQGSFFVQNDIFRLNYG
ncbi:hypothetical protein ACFE04_020563 [Oxalis oulophora]